MPKYEVVAKLVTPVTAYVEADNSLDALALGHEVITSGMGIHGDGYWTDEEFDVREEVQL
jgi:hypothetical protein